MDIEYTPEQISKSVSAAYDSVELIADLKAKPSLTEEETDMLERNEQHVRIMLEKDWFATALTPAQKTELEAI